MSDKTNIPVERHELVDGLRRAIHKLYNCRYSETPLAGELDALLKRETGKTCVEWMMDEYIKTEERGSQAPPMNVHGG